MQLLRAADYSKLKYESVGVHGGYERWTVRSFFCFYLVDMFVFTFPTVRPKTIIPPRLNSKLFFSLSSIQMIIRDAVHSVSEAFDRWRIYINGNRLQCNRSSAVEKKKKQKSSPRWKQLCTWKMNAPKINLQFCPEGNIKKESVKNLVLKLFCSCGDYLYFMAIRPKVVELDQ